MATVNSSNTVTLVEIKHSLIPKKWGETVRVVDMSECQQVAISLAHAFAADDLACYLLNSDDMAGLSPEEKWKLHVDIFQYIVAAHCLNGETHVIGPDHEGVALWSVSPLLPGKSPCPARPYLRFEHSFASVLKTGYHNQYSRLEQDAAGKKHR